MNWSTIKGYIGAQRLHSAHVTGNKQGRRAVKGKAKHYGVPLKNSKVFSMSVESQPFQRKQN